MMYFSKISCHKQERTEQIFYTQGFRRIIDSLINCPDYGRISVIWNLLQSRNLLSSLLISSMRICSNEQINLKISSLGALKNE